MCRSDLYYLFFSYFLGIGPITFDLLVQQFGSAEAIYCASDKELQHRLKDTFASKLIAFRKEFNPEKEYERLSNKNIAVVCRLHPSYPYQLRELRDAPICLYMKGNIKNFDYANAKFFAIVGTRTPTDYGQQVASRFSAELSEAGFVIVSGLARGIDAIAHKAALSAKGKTIAFLGCGVNIPYPPSNAKLYDEILLKGGLIISEFPPDMMVKPGLFVQRNRLISGLSQGILVAEGLKDSGSLITARFALEQGKEVFAPPAPITSAQSEAPNMLLKEGAKMVTCIQDILDEFHMQSTPATTGSVLSSLSESEQQIYKILLSQPQTSDELAYMLSLPIQHILMTISGMELKGVISKGSAAKYLIS